MAERSRHWISRISLIKAVSLICLFTASTLLSGCSEPPHGIHPVTSFDIKRYQGTWYEIMRLDHRFERGLTNVTATYDLRDDGKVHVLNRGYNAKECLWEEANGVARFLKKRDLASLSVTFFWPFSGGYHVFTLDHNNYEYALVSGPSRGYLWILARKPKLEIEIQNLLIEIARERDFPVENLILVDHEDSLCNLEGKKKG